MWTEEFQRVCVHLSIADEVYPLLQWVQKPYPEEQGITQDQGQLNYKLGQGKIYLSRTFKNNQS